MRNPDSKSLVALNYSKLEVTKYWLIYNNKTVIAIYNIYLAISNWLLAGFWVFLDNFSQCALISGQHRKGAGTVGDG